MHIIIVGNKINPVVAYILVVRLPQKAIVTDPSTRKLEYHMMNRGPSNPYIIVEKNHLLLQWWI